jgi:hypothetical protein
LSADPLRADSLYFLFPTWVEICRIRKNIAVTEDLQSDYFAALAQLPQLACKAASKEWDEEFSLSALAAIAVAKQSSELAAPILELTQDVIPDFQEWFSSR